jgi:adenine-specific DNA methylase
MATKKELLAQEIAKAVGAGKPVALETVDFNDPNRPKTCLEVDFPILPVNQVAVIEGNAGKPIYQMSKWWARRRSSVFRSMLIAAATKAPPDPAHAAKLIWDNYYANHQKKGAFKHLKVADIFMGGGTTLVEGSRLGMQMWGNDLNPVAWFVVKQELANVNPDEVKRLLADIEAEVRPQIIPFYYCDGPNGEKGKWTYKPTGRVMEPDFDPLSLKQEERKDYGYEGPEIIYTFWAKHGPCQVTGCGHRTPIMTSPVVAVKTLTVKYWEHACSKCDGKFHVEEATARMAPDVPLYVAPDEHPFSVVNPKRGVICPHCGNAAMVKLGKGKNKKVELSLLIHPQWLAGTSKTDAGGQSFGGAVQDDSASTVRWNQERARTIRLLEVRGLLPELVRCPETGVDIHTGKSGGTIAKRSAFACASCGTVQDVLASMTANNHRAPMAAYAVQAISPKRKEAGAPYGGRFFAPLDDSRQLDAAAREWEQRRIGDLGAYWPRTALPEGFKTTYQRIPEHGYATFADMFNPRQMLVLTQILRAILNSHPAVYSFSVREYVLAAFQQYRKRFSDPTL